MVAIGYELLFCFTENPEDIHTYLFAKIIIKTGKAHRISPMLMSVYSKGSKKPQLPAPLLCVGKNLFRVSSRTLSC